MFQYNTRNDKNVTAIAWKTLLENPTLYGWFVNKNKGIATLSINVTIKNITTVIEVKNMHGLNAKGSELHTSFLLKQEQSSPKWRIKNRMLQNKV